MVFSDEMGVTVNVAGTVNASPDDCGTQPGRSLPCAHPPLGVLWWLKQSATNIHYTADWRDLMLSTVNSHCSTAHLGCAVEAL